MPLNFHMRLNDAQVRAIDRATEITDPRTGLTLHVTRQEVVGRVLDQWIAAHDSGTLSAAPPSTAVVQPEPALADSGPPRSDQAAVKLALAERVRALRHQGLSYPKIVALFNDEGIATFSGKPGAKWSNSTIVHLQKFQGGDADRR